MTTYAVHSWGTLPTAWGAEICTYLDDRSRIKVREVCKSWYDFVNVGQFMTNGHLDQSRFSHLDDFHLGLFFDFVIKTQPPRRPIRSITLDLRQAFDYDKAAEVLTSLKHLEIIHFGSGHELTSLAFLTKLSAVKVFEITSSTLVDEDLDYLRHLSLKQLECAKWRITQISALTTLPLTDLRLIECKRLGAKALDALEQMPLKSLSLCGSVIDRLPSLNATNLHTLDISFTHFLDQSCMPAIAQLTSLTALNLTQCQWLNSLIPLQTHTSLTSLSLSQTRIGDSHLKELPAQLENLDLSYCYNISDVTALCGLKHLEHLNAKDLYRVKNFSLIERPSLTIEKEKEETQLVDPTHVLKKLRRTGKKRMHESSHQLERVATRSACRRLF